MVPTPKLPSKGIQKTNDLLFRSWNFYLVENWPDNAEEVYSYLTFQVIATACYVTEVVRKFVCFVSKRAYKPVW